MKAKQQARNDSPLSTGGVPAPSGTTAKLSQEGNWKHSTEAVSSLPKQERPTVQCRLLPLNVVAEMLSVKRSTVNSMIRDGRLEAVNVSLGKKRPTYRIRRQEVERYLAEATSRSQFD